MEMGTGMGMGMGGSISRDRMASLDGPPSMYKMMQDRGNVKPALERDPRVWQGHHGRECMLFTRRVEDAWLNFMCTRKSLKDQVRLGLAYGGPDHSTLLSNRDPMVP